MIMANDLVYTLLNEFMPSLERRERMTTTSPVCDPRQPEEECIFSTPCLFRPQSSISFSPSFSSSPSFSLLLFIIATTPTPAIHKRSRLPVSISLRLFRPLSTSAFSPPISLSIASSSLFSRLSYPYPYPPPSPSLFSSLYAPSICLSANLPSYLLY